MSIPQHWPLDHRCHYVQGLYGVHLAGIAICPGIHLPVTWVRTVHVRGDSGVGGTLLIATFPRGIPGKDEGGMVVFFYHQEMRNAIRVFSLTTWLVIYLKATGQML